MRQRSGMVVGLSLLAMLGISCARASTSRGGASEQNRLGAEEIAAANASTLYDVVHRLRPRWLEVRAPRGFSTETEIVVFMNRTMLGGVDELRRLGPDVAAWLEYLPGAAAQGHLPGIGNRHVEGAIVIHTVGPRQ